MVVHCQQRGSPHVRCSQRVTCKVEETEVEGSAGPVAGVEVICPCGNTAESAGTGPRSVGFCCAELRRTCPYGKSNYYVAPGEQYPGLSDPPDRLSARLANGPLRSASADENQFLFGANWRAVGIRMACREPGRLEALARDYPSLHPRVLEVFDALLAGVHRRQELSA